MVNFILDHLTPQTFYALQWALIGLCALGAARALTRMTR